MKIVAYDGNRGDERIIRLRLVEDEGDGCVDLIIVDEDGNEVDDAYILSITPKGTLKIYCGVNSDFGLQLDQSGKIVVKK